jgi:regulator of replication initiation timing
MAKKKLHPSVQQFKEYVQDHPDLIKQVRSGRKTWQELYEEWYLFGEENSTLNENSKNRTKTSDTQKEDTSPKEEEETAKKDWVASVLGAVKNMDPNQLQHHILSISSALGAIQGVISSLQGGGSVQNPPKKNVSPPSHPFQFRQD